MTTEVGSTDGGEATSGDGDGDGDGDPATSDPDPDPNPDEGLCGALACEDALALDLSLQEAVSAGAVSSIQVGDDWVSEVDATAGGTMAAPTNPWVYLRFGVDGLEKVEIDDFAALSSGAWDIAAKRFGVRVNSGSSGPGCVEVAAVDGAFAEVDEAPDPTSFAAEDFYDDSCVLVEDMSGQPGSAAFAMAGWWGYAGCVTTTGQVYVLSLADGQLVKLTVEAYYGEGQTACNEDGAMGSGSAEMTWRWRYL